MAADTIPLTLRLPRTLHAYLVREAASNYRSVGAEILAMLTTYAERDEDERFLAKYGDTIRQHMDVLLAERALDEVLPSR